MTHWHKFFKWCPEDVVVKLGNREMILFPEKLNFLEVGQNSFTLRLLPQPERPFGVPKDLGCTVDVKIEVPIYYLEREVNRSEEILEYDEYGRYPYVIEGRFTLVEERLLVNTEHLPIW